MRQPRVIITVTNNLVTDNRVGKLAAWLVQRGYKVVVVGRTYPGGDIPPENRAGEAKRFNLLFNKGPLFYAEINARHFLYLLTHRADVIISVDLDTLPAGRLAGWVKGTPVVLDSHEYFPEVPELVNRPLIKKIWVWLERLLVPGVAAGITVSGGIVDIYKKKYNIDFLLVRNIPSAGAKIIPIREVRSSPVVYYQGALNVGRGLEASIMAMNYLPGYRLKIVGTGDIKSRLVDLARSQGLQDRVSFVGPVPFEELRHHAMEAHVGLCLLENLGLNYFHSLPNRVFDYPRLGLPVIATAFPEISSVVNNYETGLLVDNLEPAELALAIRKACEDGSARKRWELTLPKAAQELTWEFEVKVLEGLFKKPASRYPAS